MDWNSDGGSVFKLRYSQPNTPRAFKIPGGIAGVWIIGGLGLLSSGFTFLVSLMPPGDSGVPILGYAAIMLIGTAPQALAAFRNAVLSLLRFHGWSNIATATLNVRRGVSACRRYEITLRIMPCTCIFYRFSRIGRPLPPIK